ncbi:hypothetical protein [Mesorhizobium sp. STM 4661]|uniref:hypothetical protein n=1 Tax=Mesorhizobium sp. STM 4661 TaxID=1297570 RepID=UPI0002BE5CF9|nr:hypothetical protein [Mesorhizobium sp. STM 4661]CCV11633.1 conserved membrane hypothetical protein [Mesorhizobium sp. STM 4661]
MRGLAFFAKAPRVPLVSVAGAAVAFALLPEARDLLIYPHDSGRVVGLVLAIIVLWSLPLYVWTRRRGPPESAGHILPGVVAAAPFGILLGAVAFTKSLILSCNVISSLATMQRCLETVHNADLGVLDAAVSAPERLPWAPVQEALANGDNLAFGLWIGLAVVACLVLLDYWLCRRFPGPGQRARVSYPILALGLAGLIVALAAPASLGELSGPLVLTPVLFGGWIVPLALLTTAVAIPIRVLAAVAFIGLGVFSAKFQPDYHDLQTFASRDWQLAQTRPDRDVIRQSMLADSTNEWLVANGCDAANPAACETRPIIIAAEGGASRSAFFVSTVLGALLDVAYAHPDQYADPAKQIFLLSGVSGGSLGVTTFRTALVDSPGGARPPCIAARAPWAATPSIADPSKSWRTCLQSLVAGDYLTSTVAGILFRDPFGSVLGGDRAVALGTAIERHYASAIGLEETDCEASETPQGLCRPFGYLRAQGGWEPLLALNATDATTGRPVIVSDFQTAIADCATRPCVDLFTAAHNIFEFIGHTASRPPEVAADEAPSINPGLGEGHDIKLSTAIVLSARFPLVSPAAIVKRFPPNEVPNGLTNVTNARLVDGGYFDDSGLEMANKVVAYLQKLGLRPVVVLLRSSPTAKPQYFLAGRPLVGTRRQASWTTPLKPWTGSWLDDVAMYLKEPFDALYMARTGHVEAAREDLFALSELGGIQIIELANYVPIQPVIGTAKVRAAKYCFDAPSTNEFSRTDLYKAVVSWSLSPLAERALDAELCDRDNAIWFGNLMDVLRISKGS